jgi:hypothetical protein
MPTLSTTGPLTINKSSVGDVVKTDHTSTSAGGHHENWDNINAQFNHTTGHDHTVSGAHIPTSALVAGAVTQSAVEVSAAAETTTSATAVALTTPRETITTVGGNVVVSFTGSFSNDGAARIIYLYTQIDSDGWVGPISAAHSPGAGYMMSMPLIHQFNAPAAGSHTITIGWATSAGTATAHHTEVERRLLVTELKR